MPSSTVRARAPTGTTGFRGLRIVYAAIGMFGVMCGACLVFFGFGEEGVRVAIRATARTTAAVFVVVFCLSSVRRRWPRPLVRWGMRNRRYLGLSAAVSHGYHLCFILSLYVMGVGDDNPLVIVIGGGWGFGLLFTMAVTSNDASQKTLGKYWRRVHLLGMWTIWSIFAVSYFPAAATTPSAAVASLALVIALLLRVWPQAGAATTSRRAGRGPAVTG